MNLVDSNQAQNNNLMVSEAASERTLWLCRINYIEAAWWWISCLETIRRKKRRRVAREGAGGGGKWKGRGGI
ncbi:hypothetical protein CsSME_00046475 [Camellia sinensis var. sinensis]